VLFSLENQCWKNVRLLSCMKALGHLAAFSRTHQYAEGNGFFIAKTNRTQLFYLTFRTGNADPILTTMKRTLISVMTVAHLAPLGHHARLLINYN
jgi:hypothetical protein